MLNLTTLGEFDYLWPWDEVIDLALVHQLNEPLILANGPTSRSQGFLVALDVPEYSVS